MRKEYCWNKGNSILSHCNNMSLHIEIDDPVTSLPGICAFQIAMAWLRAITPLQIIRPDIRLEKRQFLRSQKTVERHFDRFLYLPRIRTEHREAKVLKKIVKVIKSLPYFPN